MQGQLPSLTDATTSTIVSEASVGDLTDVQGLLTFLLPFTNDDSDVQEDSGQRFVNETVFRELAPSGRIENPPMQLVRISPADLVYFAGHCTDALEVATVLPRAQKAFLQRHLPIRDSNIGCLRSGESFFIPISIGGR